MSSQQNDPFLQISSIDTHYGLSHILHDVSLNIYENEIVALVGRNGAGKSTTLRSIVGLTPPTNGAIVYNGADISGEKPNETRKRGISLVPEDRRVFPKLSVEENFQLASMNKNSKLGVNDIYNMFPDRATMKSRNAGALSGGQQQMLAIGRALLGPETELLLLDEPTEGLAPQIVADLHDIIRDLNDKGITILLVEQNADLALQLANRAYVIETGRIVVEEDADTLRQSPELLQKYLGV